MADSICFVATALSNTGKKGIIKPDSNGAYWMPVGALGVYNSQGHFYDYDESVKVLAETFNIGEMEAMSVLNDCNNDLRMAVKLLRVKSLGNAD